MLLVSAPLFAESTARIEGLVTDSSGALLPGATVTATHVATNVSRTAVTTGEGAYAIPALPVGDYTVSVDLSGFNTAKTTARLTVGQVARMDFKLHLGMAQEVTVTAASPVIEKTTSEISTLISAEQVENLPLNGRNFTQLATLTPGVNRGTPGSNASGGGAGTDSETFRYAEFGGAALSVNGLREQFNNFQIEGLDNNESLVNTIAYMPPPEAIREFSVITTNAPAEFGRAAGAVQNLVLKSGTNELNGTLYDFYRPKSLAAKPKFAAEKPDFNNNDFGVTVGGPIMRDRMFFFASYHGLRNDIPVEAGNYVTVPTAKMRTGDFSELLNPAVSGLPNPIIIYNPNTGQPFAGNIIPANMINAVGQRYLNVFPMPTRAGVTRNYLTHRQKKSVYDDFDLRLDFNLTSSDLLFFSGSQWDDSFSDPGRIPGYQAGFGAGTSENTGYSVRLGESHVFSGNLVNEARFGWTDFHFAFLPVGYGTDQNAELGIPGPGGVTRSNGISLIGGGDGTFLEYLGDYGQYKIPQQTIQFADTATYIRGVHTFKFGATVLRRTVKQERTQIGKGFYIFRTDLGFAPGFTGYEVSDILAATTAGHSTGIPGFVPRETVSWENAIFLQDDWHIRPNLTLNLGLRWDVLTPYYETDNKMANWDPKTRTLVLPEEDGAPRATIDTDMDNVGPRLGFNYQLNDRTVVRGGYGIFYSLDRGGIDNQLTENPPFVLTEAQGQWGSGVGGRVRISEPIPLPTPVDPNNPQFKGWTGLVYIPRDSEVTEVQQWNIGLQREIFANTSAMVAYVGNRADNLAMVIGTDWPVKVIRYIGYSSYDALQMSLRRSETNGLSYLASYTYGDARNLGPGFFPGNPTNYGVGVSDRDCLDPSKDCDLSLDEGPADYDAEHRFTLAGTYKLPFAQDNPIMGGWSVNTVLTYQSGTPYSVFKSGARVGERNSARGRDTKVVDLSIFKTFGMGTMGNLEFRIEGFNIFNTPQYTQPGNNMDDVVNFGRVTGTRLNSERQIQLAARYIF